ncbi:UNVERIFIED_CONTAM: hypothetical protein GTU68_053731 [Idotea baltica]|nr:hypothetical protein [Idotea baltica]
MSRILILSLALCCVAVSAHFGYQLPANHDLLLRSPITESFTCDSLPYGYYGDIDNNCQIYHVCLPITDNLENHVDTIQFSFMCSNTTVFSQESLSCTYENEAYPCEDSRSLYESSNAEFGVTPEPYVEE